MRDLILLASLVAVLGPAFAPPGGRAGQVADVERRWSAAVLRHDVAGVANLLDDDFGGIDGRGVVTDKAAELKEAEGRPAGSQLVNEVLDDLRVRFYGDTAILTARNTATFKSEDQTDTIQYRRTTVWVSRAGRWLCVSFHGSRILAVAPDS